VSCGLGVGVFLAIVFLPPRFHKATFEIETILLDLADVEVVHQIVHDLIEQQIPLERMRLRTDFLFTNGLKCIPCQTIGLTFAQRV